jgi:hypothetical protein
MRAHCVLIQPNSDLPLWLDALTVIIQIIEDIIV